MIETTGKEQKRPPTEDIELPGTATAEQVFSIKILPGKNNEKCYIIEISYSLELLKRRPTAKPCALSGQFFIQAMSLVKHHPIMMHP